MHLIQMKSPKTGRTYGILPSRVYAMMNQGYCLVDKDQQTYYQQQHQRIKHALVVHSR